MISAQGWLPCATAQDPPDSSRYEFEEMLVTATRGRGASNLMQSNSVSVMDAEHWRMFNAQSVHEILQSTAGIEIRDNGGHAGAKLLSFRGSSSQQVVVMRNGVRISNAALGLTDLSLWSLNGLERIEVYRGGASSFFGADAVGGVVNIVTSGHEPTVKPRMSFQGSVSSFSHYVAGVSGRHTLRDWNVAVSYRREFQPDSSYDVVDPDLQNNVRRVNCGMSLHAWSGDVWRNWKDITLSVGSYWARRHAELPGTIENNSSSLSDEQQYDRIWLVNPQVRYRATKALQISTSASAAFYRIAYHDSRPYVDSRSDSKATSLEGSFEWQVSAWHRLQAGYEFGRSDARSVSTEGAGSPRVTYRFDSPVQNRHGFFAAHEWNWYVRTKPVDIIRMDPSLRCDFYSEYGRIWSPRLGVSLIKRLDRTYYTMRGSWSRNFRAPTLNERFWVGNGARGNPDIEPESSDALDAGIAVGGSVGRLHWQMEANTYRVRTRNQIVWLLGNPITPANVRSSRSAGYEWMTNVSLDSMIVLAASFTRNRSVDVSDPRNEFRSVNSPLYSWKLSASYRRRSWNVYTTTRYVSERFVDQQNTMVMEPYFLTDAGYGLVWRKEEWSLELTVDVRNVFNSAYETMSSYPGMAREVILGFRVTH